MKRTVSTELPADIKGLSAGLDFIESTLTEYHFAKKYIYNALMLSEESMVQMIENAYPDSHMQLSIKYEHKFAGRIIISAPGKSIDYSEKTIDLQAEEGALSHSSETMIRQMLLQAHQDKLNYVRKGNYNFVRIVVGSLERSFLVRMTASFLIAVVLGIILNQIFPASVKNALTLNLLLPIQTIFINTLKLAEGPTIFFSILGSVARFTSFFDPGKVSVKVWTGYAITSLLAIITGACTFLLVQPGRVGELTAYVGQAIVPTVGNKDSIRDAIVNIIPADVIGPFLNLDTLQIIFLALLFGIALGRIGDYSSTIYRATEAMENLCGKAAEILNVITPFATFICTVSLIFNIGSRSLLLVAELIGTLLLSAMVLLVIYCLILVFSGLNPLIFIRKYAKYMWETFLLGSGVTALPKTLRCCKKSLGVSSKVCSFSLPFGAIANMDGNCLYLTITALFLAKLCGVELFSQNILPLIMLVMILSIGAPIASGTVLMCMIGLLNQMGVSLTALTLLLGVNVLLERFFAMTNTLGDVTITLSVAKSEKLLDTSVYNDPNCR